MHLAYINLVFFDFAWEWEWKTFCLSICNDEAFLMWTINDFLGFLEIIQVRHSAVCTAAAPASSVPKAPQLVREKNQYILYLAGLCLISHFFLFLFFFPVISTCSQKCAPSKRQIGRVRGQSQHKTMRWGSSVLLEPRKLLFLLTSWDLSQDSVFLQVLFVIERARKNDFLKGSLGRQILASEAILKMGRETKIYI